LQSIGFRYPKGRSKLENCQHGHSAPAAILRELPDSQAGLGRHKCAACAYSLGVVGNEDTSGPWSECQHDQRAPEAMMARLPDSQAGAGRHKCPVCAYAQGRGAAEGLFPDEIDDDPGLTEGAKRQVTVNAYERNPIARARCIEHYGTDCQVCGFDFTAHYGDLGEGFIHVHHRRSLSEIGVDYVVNPVDDLIPVCPNCHAMLHRQRPALEPDYLRGLIGGE